MDTWFFAVCRILIRILAPLLIKDSYLPTGWTLVGAPVYVSVVLEAARVLEEFAALVARIPTRPPAAQSLLHTVGEVLQRGWLMQAIGDKSIRLIGGISVNSKYNFPTCPLEETGWRVPTIVRRWFSLSSCSADGQSLEIDQCWG